MRTFCLLSLAALLVGCGPDTLQEYRQEGQATTRNLIREMRSISSREQLVDAVDRLEALFDELADVMIGARERQDEELRDAPLPLTDRDHQLSAALKAEIDRLYQIEGGRDLVEAAQRDALSRLDAFEYRRSRRSER